MKCEKCHMNEATVFITQNVNGETAEMNLCESCAKESENLIVDEELSFQQFLSGLLNKEKSANPNNGVVVCSNCGMSFPEFKKRSKVGCAQCYVTFNTQLQPIIKRLHGTSRHTGKLPGKLGASLKVKKKLEKFEAELKIALMKEDYENAAILRDQIRDLKKEADL